MAAKKAPAKAGAAKKGKAAKLPPPWERENPKKGDEHKHLSPQQKAAARQRAKKAGRPYPNLVDNMAVAKVAK